MPIAIVVVLLSVLIYLIGMDVLFLLLNYLINTGHYTPNANLDEKPVNSALTD